LTLSLTEQTTAGYQLSITGSRSISLTSDQLHGVAELTFATSPLQAGTPCTAGYTTAGTR
jgi:hypothetical protein